MAHRRLRELASGYTSEVDAVDEQRWCQILDGFDDANIFHTWPYAIVTSGRRHISHLVLKEDGEIVAVAQARIAKLPFLNVGIAYVRWGPLWRRGGTENKADTFRQAVRALRNEFVCKRGLVLRLFPILFQDDPACFAEILAEEGYSALSKESQSRTILMDLAPSVQDLHEGMKSHWKRELKVAERNRLEVLEGSGDDLFSAFVEIYNEMVSRKKFVEPNDINQFRMIQTQLPPKLKMRIMLCRSGGDICSGLICSAIGKTAIYLFGATSNNGMKSRGSYLLQWKLIEKLKQESVAVYDLNGINPAKNPGTYKFKSDLAGVNGKDVYFQGRFDSHASLVSYMCVECSGRFRKLYQSLKELAKAARGINLWPKAASWRSQSSHGEGNH